MYEFIQFIVHKQLEGAIMKKKFIRDDFEKFHDYNCLIPARIIYFGSEWDDGDEEGGVDAMSTKTIIKNLIYLDRVKQEPITIYWNSPGGCWFRGMAIYDTIRGLRSPVTMIGFGMVRSMGTIIMQACKERFLAPNCDFMIHDGSEGNYGVPQNNEKWAAYGKYARNKMYDIYLEKIKEKKPSFNRKQLEQKCVIDWIMTGTQAVEFGLADKVL